jgi:hypothetical protein
MQVQQIGLDPRHARDLYREYKKHQHYSQPIDWEIQRTYQLIAQGRMVIRALESVKAAGVNEAGLPKLAICRAGAQECFLEYWADGRVRFTPRERGHWGDATLQDIELPAGSFPVVRHHLGWGLLRAMLPLIPIHLRPRRGVENYHILWEAEWERIPPRDPMLLRRIGKADLWLVVAAWDLTDVEMAALAARVSA